MPKTQPNSPSAPASPPVPPASTAPASPASATPPKPPRQKKGRRVLGWNAASCAFYAFVPIALLLLGILFFVAKTGVVRIPFLSDWYKGPQPTRMVEAAPVSGSSLIEDIGLEVAREIRSGQAPPYHVSITEEQVTSALRGGIAEVLRDQNVIVERPQIVITSSTIEASGLIRSGLGMADLLLRFSPHVHENALHFHVEEAYLGDIPLHPELVTLAEGTIFHRNLRVWEIGVGNNTLDGVQLHNGSFDLLLTPDGIE